MGNTSFDNFIHSDISKIISEYDYYLEGKIYIFKGIYPHNQALWKSNVLQDGKIITQSYSTIKIWRLKNNLTTEEEKYSIKI